MKIKFTRIRDSGDHLEYGIQVEDTVTGVIWEFFQRYSQLRNIHNTLKRFSIPISFPKKKFFGNRNCEFVQQRKSDLERYFSKVFLDPKLLKIIRNSKLLSPENIINKCANKEETLSDEVLCQSCVMSKCWEIVASTGERYLDMSCHPGSISEEDVIVQQETLIEKCKDMKFCVTKLQGSDDNLEVLQKEVCKSGWVQKTPYLFSANDKQLHVKLYNQIIT